MNNLMKYVLFALSCMLFACSPNKAPLGLSKWDLSILPAENEDGWGYIDLKGTWVIQPQFDYADYFQDGLARVVKNNMVQYIDKAGNIVLQDYWDGTYFSDGLAWVVSENSWPIAIDTKGEKVFELQTAKTVWAFNNGFSVYVDTTQKYGVIDIHGNIVIEPQYDDMKDYYAEGLLGVKKSNKWGFVNTKGELVINPQFENVEPFNEGLAAVLKNNKWGFINTKGELVINPQFEDARIFNEGLAAVAKSRNEWGYINTKGEFIIEPTYNNAYTFVGGVAYVDTLRSDWQVITPKGKYLLQQNLDNAGCGFFFNGMSITRLGDEYGLIDTNGKYLVNPQFKNIQYPQILDTYSKWRLQTNTRRVNKKENVCYYIIDTWNNLMNEKKYENEADTVGMNILDRIKAGKHTQEDIDFINEFNENLRYRLMYENLTEEDASKLDSLYENHVFPIYKHFQQ